LNDKTGVANAGEEEIGVRLHAGVRPGRSEMLDDFECRPCLIIHSILSTLHPFDTG
jgi:hypothetical protein